MQLLYSHCKSLFFILLVSTVAAQGMELTISQQQSPASKVKSLASIAAKSIADTIKTTGDLTDFNLVHKDIQDLIRLELVDVSNPDILLESIKSCSLIPKNIVSDALNLCYFQTKTPRSEQVEALYCACCDNDHNSFSIILNATDPSILMEKYMGMTPLYEAARNGYIEIVNEIIAASQDNAFKVIIAMHHNNMDLTETVLYWPLSSCRKENNDFAAQIIKIILNAAGEKAFDLITHKDRMNQSLWFLALNMGNAKIIQILLDAVDNKAYDLINISDEGFGMQNSLHKAASFASIEILNLLIEKAGENICKIILSQDNNKETALHKIAKYKIYKETDREITIAVAKRLIAAAGPYAQDLLSIQNSNGYTAMDLAM
jgi:ankyrin repeat protein